MIKAEECSSVVIYWRFQHLDDEMRVIPFLMVGDALVKPPGNVVTSELKILGVADSRSSEVPLLPAF